MPKALRVSREAGTGGVALRPLGRHGGSNSPAHHHSSKSLCARFILAAVHLSEPVFGYV